MSRPTKYEYLFILQGHYCQGWEDLTASVSRRELKADLTAYRENEGGSYRIIARRVLRQPQA